MKGNIIGYRNTPTASGASGVWGLEEHSLAVKSASWPGSLAPEKIVGYNAMCMKNIGVDGATNNFVLDESPNNYVVSFNGEIGTGSFSPFYPNGYWSAYRGYGDSNTLYTANNALLKIGSGENYTFECWLMPSSTGTTYALYSDRTTSSGYTGMVIALINGKLGMRATLDGTQWHVDTITTPQGEAVTSGWNHIAVTREGVTWRGFLNGELQWTATMPTTGSIVHGTGNHWFFRDGGSEYAAYQGWISNLRVVKSAVYTAAFTPPTAPLEAIPNTVLLALQSRSWTQDNSGNNLPLVKVGNNYDTISRWSPFNFPSTVTPTGQTGSLYFTGETSCSVRCPADTRRIIGTNNFTMECWWNPSRMDNYGIIAGIGDTGGLCFYASGTNLFAYLGGQYYKYKTFTAADVNKWVHLAAVRDGAAWRFWVNGVEQTVGAGVVDPTLNLQVSAVSIGSDTNGYSNVKGYVSQFRVVKGQVLYTGNFTPPTEPLTVVPGTILLTAMTPKCFPYTGTSTSTAYIDYAYTNSLFTAYTGPNGFPLAMDASPVKRVVSPYGGSVNFIASYNYTYPAYLTVPDATSLQMGTGDFTIEFWWWPSANANSVPIYSKGAFNTGGLVIRAQGSTLNICSGSSTAIINSSASAMSGAWNHVALVRSGTTMTLYINGVNVGTATNSTNYNNTGVLQIGYDSNVNSNYGFPDPLSNFRIVKGAAVYTANFTPPNNPVTAISGTSLLLNFDQAAIYDSTGQSSFMQRFDARSAAVSKNGKASLFVDGYQDMCVAMTPRCSNTSFTPMYLGTKDWTIECWVRFTAVSNQYTLFDFRNGTQTAPAVYLYQGKFYYTNVNPSNVNPQISGTSTIVANTWYHVAIVRTWSNYTTKMYINGALEGTANDYSSYAVSTNNIRPRPAIGSADNSSSNDSPPVPLNGYIEEFRVTQAARYYKDFTPTSLPLA